MKSRKFKIRKSIAKRFKITRTGKVLFRGSHVRHLRRKKDKARLRRQKVAQQLIPSLKIKVKKLMGEA